MPDVVTEVIGQWLTSASEHRLSSARHRACHGDGEASTNPEGDLPLRSSNTELSIGGDNEAPRPIRNLLRSKQRLDAVEERGPAGKAQADKQ